MRSTYKYDAHYTVRFEAASPMAAARMAQAVQQAQIQRGERAAEGARVLTRSFELVNETHDQTIVKSRIGSPSQQILDLAPVVAAIVFLYYGLTESSLPIFAAGGLILWFRREAGAAGRQRPDA